MKSFRGLVTFFVILIGVSCSGDSPTAPSPVAWVPPAQFVSETFITFANANPMPMPAGSPQTYCGKTATATSSGIKVVLHSSPGGTPVQVYLISQANYLAGGCGPNMSVCPGSIGEEIFTHDFNKTWVVPPGQWCIGLRNRTETLQIINGGMSLEYER